MWRKECDRGRVVSCLLSSLAWVLMLAGCALYSDALTKLLEPAQDFPTNLRKGFEETLRFSHYNESVSSILDAIAAGMRECGFAPNVCTDRNATFSSAPADVGALETRINGAFSGAMTSMQSVMNDPFFAVAPDPFYSAGQSLNSIVEASLQLRQVSDPRCDTMAAIYCHIHINADLLLRMSSSVQGQLNEIIDTKLLQVWQASAPFFIGFHVIPYLVVLSLLSLTFEMRCPPRWNRLFLSGSVSAYARAYASLQQWALWLFFFAASTWGCVVGFDVWLNLGWILVSTLKTRPHLSELVRNLFWKFPQMWETLFNGLENGPVLLFEACLAFAATSIIVLLHSIWWKCVCRKSAKPAQEVDDDLGECYDETTQLEFKALKSLRGCQLKALTDVRKRCCEQHFAALPALKDRARRLGFSSTDVDGCLAWIEKSAPIIIHLNLEDCCAAMSIDSQYRSQFETLSSGGTLDLKKRAQWEDVLFNSAYSSCAPADRCKYAALNVTNDPQGVRACRQYGYSYLLLRAVRMRTTLTAGDSAGMDIGEVATVDYYAHVLAKYTDRELVNVIRVSKGLVLGIDSSVLQGYKEAQIHGDILFSENIELIMAHPSLLSSPQSLSALRYFALRCNTQIAWIEGGINVDVPAQVTIGRAVKSEDEESWASRRPRSSNTSTIDSNRSILVSSLDEGFA